MANHILLTMKSSILIRISFSFDNASKNNFMHNNSAAYLVYI